MSSPGPLPIEARRGEHHGAGEEQDERGDREQAEPFAEERHGEHGHPQEQRLVDDGRRR